MKIMYSFSLVGLGFYCLWVVRVLRSYGGIYQSFNIQEYPAIIKILVVSPMGYIMHVLISGSLLWLGYFMYKKAPKAYYFLLYFLLLFILMKVYAYAVHAPLEPFMQQGIESIDHLSDFPAPSSSSPPGSIVIE